MRCAWGRSPTTPISPRRVTAVDDEVRAGGEARGVGGQVEDGGGYLVRLGEASKRRRREPHLGPLALGHTKLGQRRPYVARGDAVYPDATGGPFTCEALRQRDHPRLGSVVGGLGLGVVRNDA